MSAEECGSLAVDFLPALITGGLGMVRVAKAGWKAGARGLAKQAIKNTDELVHFYHGTSVADAANIRANGINLSFGNRGADFGRGFYMSTSREIAEAAGRRLYPDVEVLQFSVSRAQLQSLSGLHFDSPSANWADFTRFHKTFGPEDLMHGGTPYDFVSGPMVRRIRKTHEVLHWQGSSQFSIHTDAAVNLFNAGLR